jgi:hypothetical protein
MFQDENKEKEFSFMHCFTKIQTARSGSKYNSLSMQNRELTMMMQCWPPTASRSVGWMATKKPRSQEGRVDHRGIIGRGG